MSVGPEKEIYNNKNASDGAIKIINLEMCFAYLTSADVKGKIKTTRSMYEKEFFLFLSYTFSNLKPQSVKTQALDIIWCHFDKENRFDINGNFCSMFVIQLKPKRVKSSGLTGA